MRHAWNTYLINQAFKMKFGLSPSK